jgi:hypothetical protein
MRTLFILALMMLCFFANGQIKDVPFMEYEYQSTGCGGFKYGNGSLFFIPDNAFVMLDGSPCKGSIKIKYREFHSQIDMLVAKINMILKKDNKRSILESAGMFEMQVECDGKPMKLAEGKSIHVRMNCRRNLPDLNIYKYNKETNFWEETDSKVVDFGYKKDNNNRNNADLWGSGATSSLRDTAMLSEINPEGVERIVSVAAVSLQLPEGFFKGMNMKTLGIYNYDRVIKEENAVPMIPEFVLNNGEKLNQDVFVAYENINTLINYYPDDFAERFVLLKEKGIRMFSIFKDGSVACVKQAEMDKLNIESYRGKKIVFTLERQPKKPVTKDELAKATKLNTQ